MGLAGVTWLARLMGIAWFLRWFVGFFRRIERRLMGFVGWQQRWRLRRDLLR
jgi:hypothetical protein